MTRAACALALLLAAAPARAQDAASSADDVQAWVAEAVREYDAGNYLEAHALFLRVHEARPTARSQRALGKTSFELHRYRESVRWLEASLADERSPLTPEMRAEAEELLARARGFLGRYSIRASVASAAIDVDGQPLEGETIDLEVGEHEIVARAEGHHPTTRRVTVRGGEVEVVELALVSSVAAADPGGIFREFGWASIATGGALLVAGVIATAIWADAVSTLNLNLERGACFADPASESVIESPPGVCTNLQNRYRLALPFVWVGYLGGAAFLAAGLGLVLGAPSRADATTALRCGPFAEAGIACGARF
jgi:hypothetical protein